MEIIDLEIHAARKAIHPAWIKGEKYNILVDACYPGLLHRIEKAAADHGLSLADLTHVVITHHDFDHIGSLAALKRCYPQVQVVSSVKDAPYIGGYEKSLRLQQAEDLFDSLPEEEHSQALRFQHLLQSVEPVTVDRTLVDGEAIVEGVIAIETPGHMPGHISIYIPSHKLVITGDALVYHYGQLEIANAGYTLDMKAALQSVAKIAKLDPETLLCYHGGYYPGNCREALRALLLNYHEDPNAPVHLFY